MAKNKSERKKNLNELKKLRHILFCTLGVFDANYVSDDDLERIGDFDKNLNDENELKLMLDRQLKESFCFHSDKFLQIKAIEVLIASDEDIIEYVFSELSFNEDIHDKRQFLKILLEQLKSYVGELTMLLSFAMPVEAELEIFSDMYDKGYDFIDPNIMTKEEAQAILNGLDPHKKEDIPTIVQVILKDYFLSWKRSKQIEYLDLLNNQLESPDNDFNNLLTFSKKLVCQEMLLENRDFIEEVRDLLVSIIMQ